MRKKSRYVLKNKKLFFHNYGRIIFISVFFLGSFFMILKQVFTYTISDHDFYKKIADEQQIGERKIPVIRGGILSDNTEGGLLATSVNLNDLAIDPTQVGDIKKLLTFLTDVVYEESCEGNGQTQEDCANNILHFLKKIEGEDFIYTKKYIKNKIHTKLKTRIAKKKVESVLLTSDIEEDIITQIQNKNIIGVYAQGTNVYINPEEIININNASEVLAPLISFPQATVKHLMRKRKIKYISLLFRLSIKQSAKIKEFIISEKNAIKNKFIDAKDSINQFIILHPNPHRIYPENKLSSQVLGFVDNEGRGHYGLEGYFNEILKGEAGEHVSRKDIRGRVIEPIDFSKNRIDRQGAVIYSTIDRNIQKNVESILKKAVLKYNANKGSVIIMDPQTGKIISMANYPTFDPNLPGNVYELEEVNYRKYSNPGNELIGKGVFVEDPINGKEYIFDSKVILLRKSSRGELKNYALKKYKYKNDFGAGVYKNSIISDIYEPGSIMKAITMAIGIDSGEIKKDTKYQNNGPIKIDQFKISDISKKCRGYYDFSHALNYSCNVGMVRIIQKVGKALLYNYLVDFGFGTQTDIMLDGEVTLPLKHYSDWSKAQLYSTSYGLGINVNQIQMAVAYSALANGGLILRPQIVEKIKFTNNNIVIFNTEVIRRVISQKTSDIMIDVLVDSINNGVAKTAKVEGYAIAGKTGTSQIAYKGGYESGYDAGTTHASFAGFLPAQNPKYVIIVKLLRPRTDNYGGNTSAHIFSDIAQYLLNYSKIPKLSSNIGKKIK